MAAAKSTKSAQTATTFDQAAASLVKASKEFQSATAALESLVSASELLGYEIAEREAKVQELDGVYATKSRQAEIDFNLSLQETKDKTVTEYLKSVGKEAVESVAYKALQTDLAKSISERDAEIKKAVAIENSRLTRDFTSEKALLQSQFETSTVKQVAQIESLQKENASLTAQVTQLFKQIDAERAAGIERAKASAIGSVNVGTPNGR